MSMESLNLAEEKESAEKFIERLEADIREGRAAFIMRGKIPKDIESLTGRRYVPTGEYQDIEYAGARDGSGNAMLDRQEITQVEEDILSIPRSGGLVDEFVYMQALVASSTEGPQSAGRPLLMAEIAENGDEHPAYVLSIDSAGASLDRGGRPYIDQFKFVLSKTQIESIIGTESENGGFLRRNPDMIRKLIERIAPDLLSMHEGKSYGDRRVLVYAQNFSDQEIGEDSIKQIPEKIRAGKLGDNIITYRIEQKA